MNLPKRISIFNMCLIVTIIALATALLISRQTKAVWIETDDVGIRDVPEIALKSSLWFDKSKPPPKPDKEGFSEKELSRLGVKSVDKKFIRRLKKSNIQEGVIQNLRETCRSCHQDQTVRTDA